MAATLIATAGTGYFAAVAAVFVAGLISKAGEARAPNEEPLRRGFLMNALVFAAALTPVILSIYAVIVTTTEQIGARLVLIALPILAGFAGSLIGALIGLYTREARSMFRMTSIVSGFAALLIALGVALPRVDVAWAAAETAKLVSAAGLGN